MGTGPFEGNLTIKQEAQVIIDLLKQPGYYKLRNDLVVRWTNIVFSRWEATMEPDVRALFETIDRHLPEYVSWNEARHELIRQQHAAVIMRDTLPREG